jgi:hypothetical protein
VDSGNSLASRAKNDIIAGNILREQYELVKNMRDSNWMQLRNWDSVEPYKEVGEPRTRLEPGYYTVESNFDPAKPVRLVRLDSAFDGSVRAVSDDMRAAVSAVRLCLDAQGRYTHVCAPGVERLPYASYLRVEPLQTSDATSAIPVPDAWKFTFSLVSTERGYRAYDLSAILTDWKQ